MTIKIRLAELERKHRVIEDELADALAHSYRLLIAHGHSLVAVAQYSRSSERTHYLE